MIIKTVPQLCGSIAQKVGSLGVKIHEAGYSHLGLDYRYIAIEATHLSAILKTVEAMHFVGVGLSMPFKIQALRYLDHMGSDVTKIGACNTILFKHGKKFGYNTDWIGFLAALDGAGLAKPKTALIVGAGGVARAIAYALKSRKTKVFIAARSLTKAKRLAKELSLAGALSLAHQAEAQAQLIINATPVTDSVGHPITLVAHKKCQAVFDVVFTDRETLLLKEALQSGLVAVSGQRMLLHQAARQFELYTGHKAPMSAMDKALQSVLA